jgi:V-type H+-transporting ATPase subunit A
LQQNSFTPYDYNCPLPKTVGMMRSIVNFYENSRRVISESKNSDKKISLALIEEALKENVIYELSRMKF